MRVIDLFCGAGGLSEGFRLAGFDIIWAVDNWHPAVITHQKNHPSCNTMLGDVEKIAYLPDDEFNQVVPDSEIIIGSPPCADFSNSNKSGKADKSAGLRLIKAYLRIVARKKYKSNSVLKYWIMENVPNARFHVKDEYFPQDLDLDGDFVLKAKNHFSQIYNAQFFGVPSKRIRFICGYFPEPIQTNSKENLIPLSFVLNKLGEPKSAFSGYINDPNYRFQMLRNEVTDHHYIQELAEFEWQKAKRLKQDKGYMGKMSLPEDINRPARTVMATMSFSARESMIFGHGEGRYRAPTIREIASLMSFPLDYRFYGESIAIKYKLVGNAVAPKMAFAIAKSIAENENILLSSKYVPIIFRKNNPEFINYNWKEIEIRKELPKRDVARFKYHIPYLIVNSYRVELTNYKSDFKNKNFEWCAEIHKSQGPQASIFIPIFSDTIFTEQELNQINSFINYINNQITSFNEFQKIYCMTDNERKSYGVMGPYELLLKIREFLDVFKMSDDILNNNLIYQGSYSFPKIIILGYYVLRLIIHEMEDK